MTNTLPVPLRPSSVDLTAATTDWPAPQELTYVPLIPEGVRRAHHVHVPTDHRFKAAARLLQALWREDRDLPLGVYTDINGKRRRLGSRLSAPCSGRGDNFMHPDIMPVVACALAYREPGALYDVDRLKGNLLSSHPLAFNLFGLLQRDLRLATRFMADLLPGRVREVTQVLFEHSPGRGHPRFTGDNTAFDVAIRGRSPTGTRLFVGIEIKYSESCLEGMERLSPYYPELAARSELFLNVPDWSPPKTPHQQFFRQHCLASAILSQDLADEAVLVVIAPSLNRLVQTAAEGYASQLRDPLEGRIPFVSKSLEEAITCLSLAGLQTYASALHQRYVDWRVVDAELQLDVMLGYDFPPNAQVDDQPD